MLALYWVRADGQATIDMGRYGCTEDAWRAVREGLATLLAQCTTEQQRQEILAGSWMVSESFVD